MTSTVRASGRLVTTVTCGVGCRAPSCGALRSFRLARLGGLADVGRRVLDAIGGTVAEQPVQQAGAFLLLLGVHGGRHDKAEGRCESGQRED